MDSMIAMLNQKSNIQDVCALVDLKANYEDTERIMSETQMMVQKTYLPIQRWEEFVTEQRYINESLCPLNCLGKWIWHGAFTDAVNNGKQANIIDNDKLNVSLKNGTKKSFKKSAFDKAIASLDYMVEHIKWSREAMNTSPDNLQLSKYEDDAGAILIRQAGVYEITFVFFVPQEISKPSVQVSINSRPVLSTIDSNQYVVYHSVEADRHISYTCYLQIKANSKVSLSLSNNNLVQAEKNQERVNRHLRNCSNATGNEDLLSNCASASFRTSHSVGQMQRKMSTQPLNSNPNASVMTQNSNGSRSMLVNQSTSGMPPLYNSNQTKGFLAIRKM